MTGGPMGRPGLTRAKAEALRAGTVNLLGLRATPATWRRYEQAYPDLQFRWVPRAEADAQTSWKVHGWVGSPRK